jgi:hypothetical protein
LSRERNPLMVQYEETYPLGGLSMTNEDGTRWMHRMAASESYYNDYSWDWKENQELLTDVREMERKYGGPAGGSYVMLAHSIQQNFIASTYFRNPNPLIQDKNGDQDLSKTLSHLTKSILADIGSERKMKEGLEDRWWAGFGLVWGSFLQVADELSDGTILPKKQRVLLKRMSPYRVRFDPEGREWDMSDHTYAAVLYYPTLQMLMTDRRLSNDDRSRIMASYRRGVAGDANFDWRSVRSTTVTDLVEDDPRYIRVPTWQIWARPEKKIYNQIASSQFTMTPLDWPEEFAEEDCFPFVYMPAGREPEDKEATRGFIGIPILREIKAHLYAVNRLESQFVAANQNAIFKYAMIKGALDEPNQAILQNDKQKAVVTWDPAALEQFPAQMREKFTKFSDIFELIKQPDLQELRHLEGIKHEIDMIAQIIGQAPGDRGGMPTTNTATDSVIVNKRLETRENSQKHEAGGFFKQLLKLIWLILKHRQTLPIPYQMIVPGKEAMWVKFVDAERLRDLDLHYDYAVGSNEDVAREERFGLLERLAQAVMPVMQASGNLQDQTAIARLLLEALDVDGTDQLMQSDVQDLIAQLTAINYGIQRGEINPADPAIANKQVELIAMLGDRLLTADKMKEIVTESANMASQGPAQEMGSMAKAPTPGQADFAAGARGAATAGAGGGLGR